MAGHSHAANVQYRKAKVNERKGKLFSKIARIIIVAAKTGGGDPDMNLRLKYAIDKARAANMTNDAIRRAIQKGTGEGGTEDYEEVAYEGYGPGGVALIATGLTDNRARTAGEVKNAFERRGGNIGAQGSVAWQFEKKAIVQGETGGREEDEILLAVMEAGADDLEVDGDVFVALGPPDAMAALRGAVEGIGLEVKEAEISWSPKNTVPLTDVETLRTVLGLVDDLEDNDDIQAVVANFEVDDALMAEAMSGN